MASSRQAKCCQPWFDSVVDNNDPDEQLQINNIITIRNLHAITNQIKILQCIKCKKQSPGFDVPFYDLEVLEHGNKIKVDNDIINQALVKSEVL